jgi:hypothetical protein
MTASQDRIDRVFELFRGLLELDAELRAGFEASAREFFLQPRWGDDVQRELAHRRHLEWFLLERAGSPGRPLELEVLLERHPEDLAAVLPEDRQALLGSHASVFEVTGVESGQGMWLRDLASLGEYPMQEPEASQLLRTGDMIVGRVFPVGGAMYHASRAAAFFRDPKLLEALRTDLENARQGRRTVLRLQQSDIETMFFSAPEPVVPAEGVAAARRLLHDGGLGAEDVEEILAELASEPFDPDHILPDAQDTLGGVLDRLAFESAIDLEAARRVLLAAWSELSSSGPGQGASLMPAAAPARAPAAIERPANVDVERSIAEFDRKRQSGVPLEQVFLELERDLALEEGQDEEDSPAPDFPGVVGAMVEEFLWEQELEHGPEAARELGLLRSFGRFASEIGVFENLTAVELATYTCFWLPESGELENADDAQRLLNALSVFCRWAEEKQQVELWTAFRTTLQPLQASLPRISEANRRRTRTSEPEQGELYECVEITSTGDVRLRARSGGEVRARIDGWVAQWLREGDLLRARVLPDGRCAVYCCYPPEAKALQR